MKFVTTLRKISEEEFKEQEHPRTGDGKFTSKGGGVSKKTKVSKDKKTDNVDRIENVKDNYDIKRMLKAGVQPNEMDLQLAELERKRHELGKIKTERTFKVDLGNGNEETEIRGTPEYEKVWKELDELRDKVSKKEEDEYRKSYGWKEGDPFRWTPHNDDPDTADTSGDYGSDYTYKHLTEEESDVIMRRWWNDDMNRKERESKYDYLHHERINYLNEDDKTPQELEEEMGHWDGTAEVSDYFFFTDKKTRKQFRGIGMTQKEIKNRAEHGIGSSTTIHPDGSETEKIVYDRPLDYDKFHSKTISAYNFGEKGRKTDKLWDDLDDDERGGIKQDYKFDGEFYNAWQEEQEKLFYDWKSKQGNTGGDKVNGKHNELYSEYGISEKTDSLNNVTLTDDDRLDYAHKLYKDEYLEKHSDEELIDVIKRKDDRWALKDKKRGIMGKISGQTYFQQGVIERQKYVGVLFNGLNAYDKDMLAGNAFDYEAPLSPTEDDELRWKDLSDDEQMDIRKVVEDEEDEDSPRYDLEETFKKLQPKKAIGFDYEKGIPEPQNVDILSEWANRMHPFAYYNSLGIGGGDSNTKETIIPQYPKVKQRTIKEHENQVKQLDSELKKETEKHKPTDAGEYWEYSTNTIAHDVEEFGEYVEKNESKLNLDLEWYKRTWDEKDWLYGKRPPKNEKEWRKHFIKRALRVGDSKIASKVHQLRHFTSLIKQNPKLAEKYQHILDKTDKLNHDNYDLFLKTPEFYRGTRTLELDHYLEYKNTGKQFDWSEKNYPYTALGMDKSTSQSPSEQRIDWEMKDGELSGGKVLITYEGDSVRELGIPVQYNTQSVVNDQGADGSEIIGFPNNMVSYTEREVRVNPNSKIPKIKELNFGINMGKYKDQKTLPVRQRKMLLKKYLPLVGGDKSKIKFYKFVERGEAYAVEEFVEDEHPRDDDGKFADKDGSNARVERQKSILQQEIEYLRLSLKEESKKYRPFEKVSDEDHTIRWVNKSVGEKIKELEEELNSSDTIGLPYIPLKPNTHEIETIDNGMYLANSDSEPKYESEREAMKSWSGVELGLHPLEGFKKGNSTIKVSLDIKEKSDSGIHREVAEEQINMARIMWNSLSDEERDSIHNLTIEKRPSIKYVKNEKGEDVLDSASVHEASVVGSWAFADNELTIRIDPYLKPEVIKGTFIHEVGHSMYHKLQEKHPERIKKWKEMVEKIPPTTKYGKYNLKRWKDGAKQLNQMEKDNWEWQEVVQRDYGVPKRDDDGNIVMVRQPIAKVDREIFRNNALSNVAFYKDLYFNEIHSEVHMYMMGQQKRGHMKKTGKATKGITKFVEPYRLLHDLPKMEEPLVVGEAEEDSPVMEFADITESIGEVVIYLDEYFERVLNEDEGEYEFVIELNDDMTIKRYSIRSMWEETATEEFKEEEHPREGDGKFASKGSSSNGKGSDLIKAEKIYDKTINITGFEETHKNLIDTVRNSSIKVENKMALNRIIKNWDLIQEKIAKEKGCTVDDHGNYKTYDTVSTIQNDLAGKDPNQMENVCSSSAKTLKKYVEKTPALKQFKIKSEVVRGNYLGKGKSHNVANKMWGDVKTITDKNKDDNNVTKWLYDKGYKEWYGGIQHEWLRLDDGTIIDGSFGQMLPNKVENMYQRLVIITPDDPRQKWYIDHEWGLPENKDDWHLFGLESEFKEEEHPRENDGKFAKKGSGSSSGQAVLHKTTHDFLKKWLSDVSMSNTQIFGSIMGKGGLDITYTHKNPDYDQDIPESDDNPKKYTMDSPINNTYKLTKVLGIGIKSKKSQKEWSDSNNEFLKLIDTNPDLNKVFKEYKGEVDGQNKMLQKKYKESKVFYRGTSVDELDAIFGFGEGSYSDTEYAVNHISKWRSRYTFKSLSMNHDETLKMYNAGMMIHFNSDTVRKAGRLMDYKAEPTQYLHADVDSSIDQTKIENTNTDNPAFLIDEEEVRIDNSKMEGVKIDKIDIYLRGGSRPDGSSSTFDVINKLVNRFGITDNLPKWYELNRMELLGKDQLLDGKKDDKNFERVFSKDPKGVKYVKSIIDRKTGKTYPEIPFKYDKDKLNDHMRNMRTEAKKDMASTVQKDLMENKLFRSKVGDVMVKW